MKPSCDFCDLESLQQRLLYSADDAFVLYPRTPVFRYHLLVIPRPHHETFDTLNQDSLSAVHATVCHVQQRFQEKFQGVFQGYNMFSNNGSAAVGQDVPHFHLHLFMRLSDESQSPFTLLNSSQKKSPLGQDEYRATIAQLSRLLA